MIPPQVKLIASLVGAALVTALLFGAGWSVRGWRADRDILRVEQQHTLNLKAISDKAAAASEAARQTESAWQQHVAEIDQQHLKEMQDAKQENERLRAAVDAGAVQLRVRAKCPAGSSIVPASAPSSGIADAGAVELDAGARSDYFALRAGIDHDRQMILGLQTYVRDVCLAPRQ